MSTDLLKPRPEQPKPQEPTPNPKPPESEYSWGVHMPEEVGDARGRREDPTSSSSSPTPASGMPCTGLNARGPATAVREVTAMSTAGSGAGTGAVVPVTASVPLSSRLIAEHLRGAW